jgi:hypothetical protein
MIYCVFLLLIRYNRDTDLLEPSVVEFYDKDLSKLSKLIFFLFRTFKLVRVSERVVEDDKTAKGRKLIHYQSTNFTIINLYLNIMGPTRENKLTRNLIILQVCL